MRIYDDDDNDDDELFLLCDWPTKCVEPCFQPGPLSEISLSQISDSPRVRFEPTQNLRLLLNEVVYQS